GIIGRNGAGKSTLLKVLSRITKPTRGRVELFGRVGSLLEVGTGFHPELTGRDNIFLNGAILGMSRQEIMRKFDEIVAFAEIDKFLDTPVKHYSSGMYVRLAFAVAAHLEPEILVVDEVLAVGDVGFQKKSLGKMGNVAKQGRTVLFVSHNMSAVTTLCERAILLDAGHVSLDDVSYKVITSYLSTGLGILAERVWRDDKAPHNEYARLVRVAVVNSKGLVMSDVSSNQSFEIQVDYWNLQENTKLTTTLILFDDQGNIVFSSISNHEASWHNKPRPQGLFRSICQIPGNLLAPGIYDASIIICANNYKDCFRENNIVRFNVVDSAEVRGDYFGGYSGVVMPMLTWKTDLITQNR
ncbi:MAG: ABC transporter ATP-binding protein, partial [Anaerolinea sp.]|nr:ABC transporter ATP-binding protein [Anaerolinea sp.]